MLTLVSKFGHDLQAFVAGSRHYETLIQSVNKAYRDYRSDIWATAPKYTPYTKAEITSKPDKRMGNNDFVGELEDLKDSKLGMGGTKRDVQDLDDVRKRNEALARPSANAQTRAEHVLQVTYSRATAQCALCLESRAHRNSSPRVGDNLLGRLFQDQAASRHYS